MHLVAEKDSGSRFSFFCGDAVKNKKPAPDVYNLAAETLGLDKSRCVVVEDSGIGNQAAKAAGMTCLVTTSATPPPTRRERKGQREGNVKDGFWEQSSASSVQYNLL